MARPKPNEETHAVLIHMPVSMYDELEANKQTKQAHGLAISITQMVLAATARFLASGEYARWIAAQRGETGRPAGTAKVTGHGKVNDKRTTGRGK